MILSKILSEQEIHKIKFLIKVINCLHVFLIFLRLVSTCRGSVLKRAFYVNFRPSWARQGRFQPLF